MRVLLTLLLSVTLAHGQSLTTKAGTDIDNLFTRAVEQGVAPGAVVIVAGKEKVIYFNAFGLQDVAGQKRMATDSIFRIASMTKPVTSAAIMLLVDQNKLKVDDPVSKYLPEFKDREVIATFNAADASVTTRKATQEVLIRHLLSHTSGLAYTFSNTTISQLQPGSGKQAEELPLLYEPGTKWTYSGSTKVLGRVVEKVTGVPLDRFLDDNFFKPLGMKDTTYVVPAEKRSRVVTTHTWNNGRLTESANPANIASTVAGDGGLASTASDYIKFLQMLLNDGKHQGKTILSKASVQAMTRNQIGTVVVDTQPAALPNLTRPFPVAPSAGRDKFSYGFQITASNKESTNLRSAGSYTWAGIYNTHFWVDPRREIAAVLMFQVLPFYDDNIMKLYQDFEEAIGKNLRR